MKGKVNFDILESLRGLAALYVCIGHSRANLWIGGEQYLKIHPKETLGFSDYLLLGLNMLTRLSTEFVIVFFVLSGFSIAHSLRKNTEAIPFYKRRFIRLYPPYVVALLWAMGIFLIIQEIYPALVNGTYQTPTLERLKYSSLLFDWEVFVKNLFYLPQPDGIIRPFWSLTMEVIFYLMAPFLFKNKKLYIISSVILFLFWLGAYYAEWQLNPILDNYLFFNIFFAIGVALYQYYDVIASKATVFKSSPAIVISLGLFFSMIALSLIIKRYEPITAFLAAIMSVILIIYLLSNNKEIKWLIGIGRFSYTLYITHFASIMLYMALYYLITKATPPYIHNSFVFIPGVFFCIGLAYVQYYFVEKKSKGILDKLRKKDFESKNINQTSNTFTNKAEKANW